MRFGLEINPYFAGPNGNPWDAVKAAAQVADESGFYSLWLYDHLLYEGGYPDIPIRGRLSNASPRWGDRRDNLADSKLGQLVIGIPYRDPALVAKMATTLDQISHGLDNPGCRRGLAQA